MAVNRIAHALASTLPFRNDIEDTILIGGGMAGVGCARRLLENGKSFRMITPEIGGRVRTSPDGRVNYGAYYVTSDYHWTRPYFKRTDKVRVNDSWYHQGDQRYGFLSTRLVKHLPALYRFLSDLWEFRLRYNAMNALAGDRSRRELINADPMLRQMFDEPASEYIRRRKLEGLFADYIDHLLWATFFCDPSRVSTFLVLAASLPMILTMHSFEFDVAAAIAGYEERIVYSTIASIEIGNDVHHVTTTSGKTFLCRNMVMATPMDITNRLLPSLAQRLRGGIDVSFCHVQGTLRPKYRGARRNFFPSDEAVVISRELDGSYLYYYEKDNINKYFASHMVVTRDHWKPALFFHGKEFINANPLPNVFITGDHDMPNIENAFLNGRYAASLVLRQEASRQISRLRMAIPA